MPSTIVQAVGTFANSGASSLDITLAPVSIGSALVCFGVAQAAGTRSFINGGGTWVQVLDNGSFDTCYVNYMPTAGGTIATFDNGGTASGLTALVIEVNGLKPNGIVYSGAETTDTGTTAWSSSAINTTVQTFCFGFGYQGTDRTTTSTGGAGFSPLVGTNLTSGNLLDTANFDGLFAQVGDFAAGSITATGTWSAPVFWVANVFGFELAQIRGNLTTLGVG